MGAVKEICLGNSRNAEKKNNPFSLRMQSEHYVREKAAVMLNPRKQTGADQVGD